MSTSARSCTVELEHGGVLHIEEPFEVVCDRWISHLSTDLPMTVRRSSGTASRLAQGFSFVSLRPSAIVGIYPLHSCSDRAPV